VCACMSVVGVVIRPATLHATRARARLRAKVGNAQARTWMKAPEDSSGRVVAVRLQADHGLLGFAILEQTAIFTRSDHDAEDFQDDPGLAARLLHAPGVPATVRSSAAASQRKEEGIWEMASWRHRL